MLAANKFMIALILFIFVGGYIALQAAWYVCITRSFQPGWRVRTALLTWIVLTIFAPFWSRFFDRREIGWAAWLAGLTGYTWLVLVFWFGCVVAVLGAWNVLARVVAPAQNRIRLPIRRCTQWAITCVILAALWGLIEARHIRVREILIESPFIPPNRSPVRIVQLSDLHLGKPQGLRFAWKVAQKVRELRPDLIVSTGDFLDTRSWKREGFAAVFRGLEAPLGKYAVLGNHEYYTGLDVSSAFHDAAGFILLRGQTMAVEPWLTLVGVDDHAAHYTRQEGQTDERAALQNARPGTMTVLLKHQPWVHPRVARAVDLQLSGHIHGGQCFPFGVLIRLLYPYGPGMHRVSDRMLLYVSRGTGAWGTPMRVLAPPEITVFVLAPARARDTKKQTR